MYYVYFIEQAGSEYTKIGVSESPEARLRELQGGNPDLLTLRYVIKVGTQEQAASLERLLHKLFGKFRIRGEWFDVSAKDMNSATKAIVGTSRMLDGGVPQPRLVDKPPRRRSTGRRRRPLEFVCNYCEQCGDKLPSTATERAKYCSPACRQAAYRIRKANEVRI